MRAAAAAIAAITSGSGSTGDSLEARSAMESRPSWRTTSSKGRPGSSGGNGLEVRSESRHGGATSSDLLAGSAEPVRQLRAGG